MSNLSMLHTIAKGLDYLLPELIFVGGSVTELYANDAAASEVRPTNDVDCVIEVLSMTEYYKLEENLRKLKFKNYPDDGVICRWIYNEIKVDIMPNEESILGFSNEWYKKGKNHTLTYSFADGIQIKYFEASYFIATKIVALKNRGGSDLRTSTDFEDIIYVLDNRPTIVEEIQNSENELIDFLKTESSILNDNKNLDEAINCALSIDAEQERVEYIKQLIVNVSKLTC